MKSASSVSKAMSLADRKTRIAVTFSSSVLNNISKASVYRLSLISFIIGLVFFNLIWVLIDFVRDINGKTIRKKWLFVVVNIIMVGGIICSCLAYKYKWF